MGTERTGSTDAPTRRCDTDPEGHPRRPGRRRSPCGCRALGGASVAGAAPAPAGMAGWTAAVVDLPNGGIAYDPVRDVVLVAVAPSVPTLGNHLVEMDPHTGALGRSVAIGADPRALAVADDGSRAYVGGLGSNDVTEVDLSTFTVTQRFSLGVGPSSGGRFADDILVQPGNPSVIAVSMRNEGLTPRHEGVAIFDEGVPRPTATPRHTGPDEITWSDDPNVLYGYNDDSTAYGFYVLTVDASGVTMTSPGSLFTGSQQDLEHAGGEIVATNGQVVDPATLSRVGGYAASGPLEVDVAEQTAYFLGSTALDEPRHRHQAGDGEPGRALDLSDEPGRRRVRTGGRRADPGHARGARGHCDRLRPPPSHRDQDPDLGSPLGRAGRGGGGGLARRFRGVRRHPPGRCGAPGLSGRDRSVDRSGVPEPGGRGGPVPTGDQRRRNDTPRGTSGCLPGDRGRRGRPVGAPYPPADRGPHGQ